jgi:hypothetical protein
VLKTKKYDEEHEIHFAKSLVKLVKTNEKIEGYFVKNKLVILNGRRFDQILCFSKNDRTKRKNGIRSVLCL